MVSHAEARRRSMCFASERTVVALFLLLPFLSVSSASAAEGEPKRLAKPHPYLVATPPLTEDDFLVFVAMRKPCTIEANGKGLTELASELSTLAKVDVKVDADELRRAKPKKIDPNIQVTAKHKGVPLQSILWKTLPPLGLDYRVKNGGLIITSQAKCTRHLVEWKYPVSDLCTNKNQFDDLISQVHAMMPLADWENLGGYASLKTDEANRCFTVSHTQSNQDRILEFLVQHRRMKKSAAGAR